MIIVWVNKRDWKTPGPIVNMALHNAASFADLGYETHLFIGAGKPSDTRSDLDTFYGVTAGSRLRIHRVPRYRLFGASYSISVFIHAYRRIKQLAANAPVAVFTRESGFLFFLSRLCKRYKNVKGFYELHDLYADLSWVDGKEGGHHREWLYEHLLLPAIDGIVCITREQEKRYNAIFPNIPSCAFSLGTKPLPDRASPEEKRRRRTLMYVGHMHTDKGIDFLLGAARRLARENVHVLFWGGKPEKVAAFEKRAAALGISGHVRFAPFQPPQQMHRAMASQASLGVVMLKDTYYNRYLTCPVKALDYLSHGIPAIGSDIPSVHEVLGDAGTYVPPDHLDRFVDAVLALLNDPVRYATMATRARQRADEISWQMRAKTLADFAASMHFPGEPAGAGVESLAGSDIQKG
jgi:glycosyltransferase involved in cell wall biosynthesis